MARRGFREDTIYFDHSGDCRDARHHKGCPGRWRAEVSLGHGPDGKRIRPKVSGRTKQEVKDKLGELHRDLEAGIRRPDSRHTVAQAIADWLREGFDGRSRKTVALNRDVLQPVIASIGKVVLRELTTRDVRRVLAGIAATHSTDPAVPPHVAVWRSVRAHGDTKTEKSRRTLALPGRAVEALSEHWNRQAEQRLLAGELWQDHGLVFCTAVGTPLAAGNVRRTFKKITKAAGLGEAWTPRELRTSFVSLMSDSGVPVEEIARWPGTLAPAQPRSCTAASFGR